MHPQAYAVIVYVETHGACKDGMRFQKMEMMYELADWRKGAIVETIQMCAPLILEGLARYE